MERVNNGEGWVGWVVEISQDHHHHHHHRHRHRYRYRHYLRTCEVVPLTEMMR